MLVNVYFQAAVKLVDINAGKCLLIVKLLILVWNNCLFVLTSLKLWCLQEGQSKIVLWCGGRSVKRGNLMWPLQWQRQQYLTSGSQSMTPAHFCRLKRSAPRIIFTIIFYCWGLLFLGLRHVSLFLSSPSMFFSSTCAC